MEFVFPLLLAFLAGISTVFGSLLSLVVKKKPKFCYLCVAFGFSAGVMIFISFTELLREAIENTTLLIAFLGFFSGILLIYLIDVFIPHTYEEETVGKGKLKRTALLLTLGIAIHNFPEGIAVMFSSVSNTKLGILMAIAIALHNIPEGVAISLPILYTTKSRSKAFWYSFLSGIVEPIGAIVTYLFLYQFLNPFVLGIILSAVAGIMVFISFDELLPYVYKYKDSRQNPHLSMLGLFLGMLVMAVTILIL